MINLFKSIRSRALQRGFAANTFKDYYAILGIPQNATPKEIKEAYSALALKYNPTLYRQGNSLTKEEAGELFQEAAEAYAVLSSEIERLQYDLDNQKNPEVLRQKINRVKEERGKDGSKIDDLYDVNQYGRKYRDFLKNEKKLFSVGNYNTYKGGLPREELGRLRGTAWDIPGRFHSPQGHDDRRNPVNVEQFVDQKRVQEYENLKHLEREIVTKRGTWMRAEVEEDFFDFSGHKFYFKTLRAIFLFFLLTIVLSENRNFHLAGQYEDLKKAADSGEGLEIKKGIVTNGSTAYKIHDNGTVKQIM